MNAGHGTAESLVHPAALRRRLAELGFHPSRKLGQNFLIDENVRNLIVAAAELGPDDGVLEIGPGPGALTEAMLPLARRVVAVEKDTRLAALLRSRFGDDPRFELVEGDALDADLAGLLAGGLDVTVSNLPYSDGTRILVDLVHAPARPRRMVVTLQDEVIARLLAPPGTADYGLLAIWVRRLYEVARFRRISASCFFPAPGVVSAVAILDRRPVPLAEISSLEHWLDVTRHFFAYRRKQMQKILQGWLELKARDPGTALMLLAEAGVDPKSRPENLDIPDWARLCGVLGG